MSNSFLERVFVSIVCKSSAQRGLPAEVPVIIFIQVDDKRVAAGTAVFSKAGADGEGNLAPRFTTLISLAQTNLIRFSLAPQKL